MGTVAIHIYRWGNPGLKSLRLLFKTSHLSSRGTKLWTEGCGAIGQCASDSRSCILSLTSYSTSYKCKSSFVSFSVYHLPPRSDHMPRRAGSFCVVHCCMSSATVHNGLGHHVSLLTVIEGTVHWMNKTHRHKWYRSCSPAAGNSHILSSFVLAWIATIMSLP